MGGRGVGILLGILLVNLIGELTPLVLLLEIAGILGFFYAHYCGRLAYTYMNAGLYLNAVVMMNTAGISTAWVNGGWMFLALVVGVSISYLVTWLTFGEADFSIDPGQGHLFPLRAEPMARAAQMTTTMLVAQYVFFAIDLPPDSNTFGLFLLSVIPDLQSMIARRRVYVGGFLSATVAAVVTYLILNRLPHFALYVAIIGFSFFTASWVAQGPTDFKSVGTEFGTVFPLLVIRPFDEILSPASTLYNIIALYVFVGITFLLGYLWVDLGWVSAHPGSSGASPPRPEPASINPGDSICKLHDCRLQMYNYNLQE